MIKNQMEINYKNRTSHINILFGLKALKDGGAILLPDAADRLKEYESSEEFKSYFSENQLTRRKLPLIRSSIEDWIKYLTLSEKIINDYKWSIQDPKGSEWREPEDNWKELCKKFPNKAIKILRQLYKQHCWKSDRCNSMLDCWTQIARQSTKQNLYGTKRKKFIYMTALAELLELDEKNYAKINVSVILLSHEIIPVFIDYHKDTVFFNVVEKIIKTSEKNDNILKDFTQVINHPVGMATELIIKYQLKKQSHYKNGLFDDVKNGLDSIIDSNDSEHIYGIAMIASYINDLYSFDSIWAIKKLLPLFNWKNKINAKSAWIGYFSNVRWSLGLLKNLRVPLLDTVHHLDELNLTNNIYSNLICTIAFDQVGVKEIQVRLFTNRDLCESIKHMPAEQRSNIIRIVAHKLRYVSQYPEIYWDNTVKPFFKKIWPKDKHVWDNEMQLHFENIILFAKNRFPDAVELFSSRLAHGRDIRQNTSFASPLIAGLARNIDFDNNVRIDDQSPSTKKSSYLEKYPKECFKLLAVALNQNNILSNDQPTILLNFLASFNDEKLRDSPEFDTLQQLAKKQLTKEESCINAN